MLNLFAKALRTPLLNRVSLSYKLASYFAASSLAISKSSTPAVIERKPDEILIKQWWSQTPFDNKKPLAIPVFSFQSGEFIGENVELDQSIFNIPLRRDIVHKVYRWRINLHKIRTDVTRTKGTTAGSGKKPHRQKGTGRARQGNLRAPGRKKGGKAHGAKMRDYSYNLPKKIRLHALKVMLSAKLAEGKIRIVDSEKIAAPKTKLVSNILKQFDPKYTLLFVTGYKADGNFLVAQENIRNLEVSQPNRLNILKLLKCDRLVITKEGLEQLIQDLKDRTEIRFTVGPRYNREVKPSEIQRGVSFKKKKEMPTYDPTQPLNFKFKVLQDYLQEYEQQKKGEAPAQQSDNKKTQ